MRAGRIEQDPVKLMRLVQEINRLLLEKEERLLTRQQLANQQTAG
ncbi:MAG TPA: hypothetical protein VGU90_00095 [Terriglobales bacterium]|nr:hypothetical protein [Terriglobales bacterium]